MNVPRFLIAALVLAALSWLAMPAEAGRKHYDTEVTIKSAFKNEMYIYKGRVKSDRKPCRKRQIVLLNEATGDVERDRGTSRRGTGRYRIAQELDSLGDDYYVVAERKATSRFVCKKARSAGVPAFGTGAGR